MHTLIVYATHHGCTEKAAQLLKHKLMDKVQVLNLKKDTLPDLADFDRLIIGGSIHAGMIQGSVKKFYKKHMTELLEKPLGLFLCCMYEDALAQKQFEEAYPEVLRKHAKAAGLFGGAFDFGKMNFIEKKIVEKVAGVKENTTNFSEEAIEDFAKHFQSGGS